MHARILALVATCLTALADPAQPVSTLDDPAIAYRAAAAQAGKGADGHVRLALWCEAHGLAKEYKDELAAALRLNPNHAGARGLCGMVKVGGNWLTPGDLAEQAPADAARAERLAAYDEKRSTAGDTAKDHVELAAWCLAQGLKDESHLHLSTSLRRDPAQPDVMRKLGYKLRQSHWVNEVHEAQAKHRFIEARDAHRVWSGKMVQLAHARLNPSTRAMAEAEFATVYDPNAAPAIWSVFVDGGNVPHAARLFSQIEGPEATFRLVMLALGHYTDRAAPRVAKAAFATGRMFKPALEMLANRDPREYVGVLIDQLRPPPTVEVRPINGPGIPGAIIVNGVVQEQFPIISWTEYRIRTTPPVLPPAMVPWTSPSYSLQPHTKGSPAATLTYHAPDPAVAQAFAHAMANPAAAPQVFAQFSAPGYQAPPPVVYDVTTDKKPGGFSSSSSRTGPAPVAGKTVDQVDAGYELYVQKVEFQLNMAADRWKRYIANMDQSAQAHQLLKALTGQELPLDQQAWGNWWKA